MALKAHPFVVSTTIQADGTTIVYDETKPGRSDAIGKAFKIVSGKAALVQDNDVIEGIVVDIDDDNMITAALQCGGLPLPIGTGATVNVGDRLVGALGASSARGHVKAVAAPGDLSQVAADADIDSSGEVRAAVNAMRTAQNGLKAFASSPFVVREKDSTHVLAATF